MILRRFKFFSLLTVALTAASPVVAQLAVTERSAISGSYGLELQQDGSPGPHFVLTNKAAMYRGLDVSFKIRVDTAAIADGSRISVLQGHDPSDVDLFNVILEGQGGGIVAFAQVRDGSEVLSTVSAVMTQTRTLRLVWRRSPSLGFVRFYIDGQMIGEIIDLNTDRELRNLLFGAPDGYAGLTGYYALDDFAVADEGDFVPSMVYVTIQGQATDPEDGDISEDINWWSDLDGFLGGRGGPFDVALSPGVHVITADVMSSTGQPAMDQVTITVLDPNQAPAVQVIAPVYGALY